MLLASFRLLYHKVVNTQEQANKYTALVIIDETKQQIGYINEEISFVSFDFLWYCPFDKLNPKALPLLFCVCFLMMAVVLILMWDNGQIIYVCRRLKIYEQCFYFWTRKKKLYDNASVFLLLHWAGKKLKLNWCTIIYLHIWSEK